RLHNTEGGMLTVTATGASALARGALAVGNDNRLDNDGDITVVLTVDDEGGIQSLPAGMEAEDDLLDGSWLYAAAGLVADGESNTLENDGRINVTATGQGASAAGVFLQQPTYSQHTESQ